MPKPSRRPRIRIPTPTEDRRITAAAKADPDAQPLTDEQLARMVPVKALQLRVIAAATDLTGDRDKAIHWFRNAPIGLFGDRTPEAIVSAGETEALIRHIESMGVGSAG